jgi:HAMP domain-containing protein
MTPIYTDRTMKFATKLLLALSVTVVVGATTMITIVGGRTARLLEAQLVARLEDNAQRMLENLDRYFYGRSLDVRRFVADRAFLAAIASPERTSRELQEFLRWHHEYLGAGFATMDGVPVADTAGAGGGREDLEGCWAEIAAGKDLAVCVQGAAAGDSPTIRLAVVVRDGRVARGVVGLRLPLSVLEDQLREVPGLRGSTENLHVDLLDRNGVFLYSNYEGEKVLRETSPDWGFIKDKISAGQLSGSLRYTNPAEKIGEEILVYVNDRGFRDYSASGWTLNLFVPTAAVFAPANEVRLKIAAIVLLIGSSLLTILFLLVRSFTRPLEAMDRVARDIGRGNLEARVPAGSRDELGLFAETFNRMAADLQQSHRELATFSRETEGLVEMRTAELLHTNVLLHAELSERVKAQEALAVRERLLRLDSF